jgi:alanine racemase
MAGTNYRSWVEVDLDKFAHNWREINKLVRPGVKVMQVLKADAYGHGAMEIARVALQNGAAFLGVANADEGAQLRVAGIEAPILILSPSLPEEVGEIVKYRLTPSISDEAMALWLHQSCHAAGIRLPVHLEVDSGIGRAGVALEGAVALAAKIRALPNLLLEGVFTHLAISENDDAYNLWQWQNFQEVLSRLAAAGPPIAWRHLANSGALVNYPEFQLDLVRPGIMTYGVAPGGQGHHGLCLKPVMTFKTRILLVKEFPAGAAIGYGRTFVTPRPAKIATIPVGYGDGFGFLLSNQAEVLVGGRRVPLVGRISMDLCTLDVTDLPRCEVGDEVVLLGSQGKECLPAEEIAAKVGTISYEVLCALGKRAPRVFLSRGEVGAVEPRLRRIYLPGEEQSPARMDRIIRLCLQTRANNDDLGDAIYREMLESLFGRRDRPLELRSDFQYHLTVLPPAAACHNPPDLPAHWQVKTRVSYRKILKNSIFLIGCAENKEQLAAFFEDSRCQYRWLMDSAEGLLRPERDFQVLAVKVEGVAVPIVKTARSSRGYEVWAGSEALAEKLQQSVGVEIEILTRQPAARKDFSIHIVYPTQGLDINFSYAGAGLKNVREVVFFAGRSLYPRIVREKESYTQISVPGREWVFPHSGVTFIWD